MNKVLLFACLLVSSTSAASFNNLPGSGSSSGVSVPDFSLGQQSSTLGPMDAEEDSLVLSKKRKADQISSTSGSSRSNFLTNTLNLRVKYMDLKEISSKLGILTTDKLEAQLELLGKENIKKSIMDHCGWNLLHQAVHINSTEIANYLMDVHGFDPNEFDPQFGSAVYLAQSQQMAKVLQDHGGNLYDQRRCAHYRSARDSFEKRGKTEIISLIESFDSRFERMKAEMTNKAKSIKRKFSDKKEHIYEYSVAAINRCIKQKDDGFSPYLFVEFMDDLEIGQDAGGLTKEFVPFVVQKCIEKGKTIERPIITDYNGTEEFESEEVGAEEPESEMTSSSKSKTKKREPERASYYNFRPDAPEEEVKFLGYILGLSIYHRIPVGITFAPIIYEIICGKESNHIDIMTVLAETDPRQYNSIAKLKETDEAYYMDFEFPADAEDARRPWKVHQGELTGFDQIPELALARARNIVYRPVRESLRLFKQGLKLAIDPEIVSKYISPAEARATIEGTIKYTAQDWKDHLEPLEVPAQFQNVYEWFWRAIDEMTDQERVNLLIFVTALTALPPNKFVGLGPRHKMQIDFVDDEDKTNHLPFTNTCFNKINFFRATSYEIFFENLKKGCAYQGKLFTAV